MRVISILFILFFLSINSIAQTTDKSQLLGCWYTNGPEQLLTDSYDSLIFAKETKDLKHYFCLDFKKNGELLQTGFYPSPDKNAPPIKRISDDLKWAVLEENQELIIEGEDRNRYYKILANNENILIIKPLH